MQPTRSRPTLAIDPLDTSAPPPRDRLVAGAIDASPHPGTFYTKPCSGVCVCVAHNPCPGRQFLGSSIGGPTTSRQPLSKGGAHAWEGSDVRGRWGKPCLHCTSRARKLRAPCAASQRIPLEPVDPGKGEDSGDRCERGDFLAGRSGLNPRRPLEGLAAERLCQGHTLGYGSARADIQDRRGEALCWSHRGEQVEAGLRVLAAPGGVGRGWDVPVGSSSGATRRHSPP
jgi:hypothetical protein